MDEFKFEVDQMVFESQFVNNFEGKKHDIIEVEVLTSTCNGGRGLNLFTFA